MSEFVIKGNPVFNNDPRSLSKNPPYCTILGSWVFNNFKFYKACVLINISLYVKLVSPLELPTTFDGRFISRQFRV